jgi:two-component system, NarL family, nitrate/nitrite response regulator NarL
MSAAVASNFRFAFPDYLSPMIRIVLADDHQLVLDGLRALLKDEPDMEVVAEATNGRQLLDLLKLINVNIALVDVDMPMLNGLEAVKEIQREHPGVTCIALTMHAEKGMIQKMMDAGARGYLLKNVDRSELIESIHRVCNGEPVLSADARDAMFGRAATPQSGTLVAELTDREIEILRLIAQGLSNKEIGDRLFISHRTVDTHRTNLMKKLSVHNIAGLIRFAIRAGLME